MSIKYSYNIVSVDQAARCMEVVYSSVGRQTLHIGARLPYEDETLEAVIAMYAPIAYWLEQERQVQTPLTFSGELEHTSSVPVKDMAYAKRNSLLLFSDWTQLPDVPIDSEKRTAWAVYRQALRDVPAQSGFPENINWPVAPDSELGANIPITII